MKPKQLQKSGEVLSLDDNTLRGYGCRNCVWKDYAQCPHKLDSDKIFDFKECLDCGVRITEKNLEEHKGHNIQKVSGYCPELAHFILSLSTPGDSISAVKAKFFTYVKEVQAMADKSEYHRLLLELKEFKENREQHILEMGEDDYKRKLYELESGMISFKAWWSRLTDSVVTSLNKIADREDKRKEAQGTQKITIQQLNVLLRQSDEKLKELKG